MGFTYCDSIEARSCHLDTARMLHLPKAVGAPPTENKKYFNVFSSFEHNNNGKKLQNFRIQSTIGHSAPIITEYKKLFVNVKVASTTSKFWPIKWNKTKAPKKKGSLLGSYSSVLK